MVLLNNNPWPCISIVMATYNGEQFLRQQLDSLLRQSYSNFEIIISDDFSTDRTVSILQEYATKYSTIQLLSSTENVGYVRNFEKAFQFAKGNYIAPCDQDDIWMPTKLSELYAHKGDAKMIYCDSKLINELGENLGVKYSSRRSVHNFNSCLSYLIGGSVPGHTMLIDSDILQLAFPFPIHHSHDYWLGFVATLRGKIIFHNVCLVEYRQHSNNVFGAIPFKNERTHKIKKDKPNAQERIKLLYDKCPTNLPEKAILKKFYENYDNDSLTHRVNRMLLFFKYNKRILGYKKRNQIRRWAFCLKMFIKIA